MGSRQSVKTSCKIDARTTIYFLVANGSPRLSSAFPITLPPVLLHLNFPVRLPF